MYHQSIRLEGLYCQYSTSAASSFVYKLSMVTRGTAEVATVHVCWTWLAKNMLTDVAGQERVTGRGRPRTCYRTWPSKNMLPDLAGQEHVTGRGWPRICYRTWLAKNMLPDGACEVDGRGRGWGS
jgi:hypothetical protein